ncbi:MAG: UvrD-helicase domain-containing protein [Lentisphaeria bacterium]
MNNNKEILLINASAGSGKTYRLTNDLATLLTDEKNPVAPQKILATTFTRKAGAELKQRLRQVLLEKGEFDKAQQVLEGLVGTVNSVCGQLILEHAITLGQSPSLDVLEEDNAKRIFRLSVAKALVTSAQKLDGKDKLAWRMGKSPQQNYQHRQNNDWQQDVQNIVNLARNNGLSPKQLQDFADKSCRNVEDLLKSTNKPFPWEELKNKVETTMKDLKGNPAFTPERIKAHRENSNVLEIFLREPTWPNCVGLMSLGASKTLDCMNEPGRFAAEHLLSSRELANDIKDMIKAVFACAAVAMQAYETYKQEQGLIDFVDQETLLRNALSNPSNNDFCQNLQERLQKVMVDEFQDTSPIQLDLFMKLHQLAKQGSQWVGDPKQAIYGFRGTDPELMLAFAQTPMPDIRNNTLEFSWRSQKKLIRFVNAVFLPAFSKDLKLNNTAEDQKKVTLKLPEEHQDWTGGTLEAWQLSDSKTYACLAAGIQTLLQDDGEQIWRPADLAVLCRSNEHCKTLADELAKLGIAASAPRGKLLDTFEGGLAMAAYRYCINHKDTTALTILVANLDLDTNWLKTLSAQTDAERQAQKAFKKWQELPEIKQLRHLPNETNLEILERVIVSLKLDRILSRYPNSARRLRNLDELRQACVNYLSACQSKRSSPSPAGFVAWANAADLPEAASDDANTVNVLTYHKAKGLEWPVVILADLSSEERASPFCLREVGRQDAFDPQNPLAERNLSYIPYPFGDKKKLTYKPTVDSDEVDILSELLQDSPLQKTVTERERQENRRLLYVGFTRAQKMLVLALNKRSSTSLTQEAKKIQAELKARDNVKPPSQDTIKAGLLQYEATWLDDLNENGISLFQWPKLENSSLPSEQTLTISGQDFTFTFRSCAPASPCENQVPEHCQQSILPKLPASFLEYRLNPSEVTTPPGQVTRKFELPMKFTTSMKSGDYELLGNAFHNLIALPEKLRTETKAKALLEQWTVADAISATDLLTAVKNLYDFVYQNYGAGEAGKVKIECEVPMTLRLDNGQLYQGFIDMLVKTPDGKYVIIDHKTHSRSDDNEVYAASCYGQLAIYRAAVEKTTSCEVSATLIHLPITGRIYAVELQQ